MSGIVNVLNVADGDTKLTFDKNNVAETIRAGRIVRDMLRRGYALLVEVEREGKTAYERVLEFREDTAEYIIADYDPQPLIKPIAKQEEEEEERNDNGESFAAAAPPEDSGEETATPGKPSKGRRGRKAISASSTRAVAVARSAGG